MPVLAKPLIPSWCLTIQACALSGRRPTPPHCLLMNRQRDNSVMLRLPKEQRFYGVITADTPPSAERCPARKPDRRGSSSLPQVLTSRFFCNLHKEPFATHGTT